MVGYFGLTFFWVLLLVSYTTGEKLVARRVDDILPTKAGSMAVYYDGKSDFIYLVGGNFGANYLNSILRFDITTETIQRIGSLPIGQQSSNTPHAFDSQGNLVYFSTSYSPYQIHKIDVVNNTVTTVGSLSNGVPSSAATIQKSAGEVLVVGGGVRENIYEYNLDSDNVQGEIVGQIPVYFVQAVAVKVSNNTALVFGYYGSVPYFELNLETLETKYVAVGFPDFLYGMTATLVGDHVYAFGGYFAPEGMTRDGVLKLDPITHSWEYLEVEYIPPMPPLNFRVQTEVIWVEKQNRIYMFGGSYSGANGFEYLNDIYYIDLNQTSTPTTTTEEPKSTTLSPELFSCVDLSDGTHAHPSDCSKYISCRNGTLQNVHECPPPLLYDTTTGNCNLPSLVDCQLSCANKEDGTYPHPHECNLFIICSNRDLFVFWCDPPLLFDPESLRCTLPDLVQCGNP